jgi:hypothetical protein
MDNSSHASRTPGTERGNRVIFVAFVTLFRNYAAVVDDFGDSSAYMALASAIRHWNFNGIVVQQFWACLRDGPLQDRKRFRPNLSPCNQLRRLVYRGRIVLAALGRMDGRFLCDLEFDWLQRSYLGGSEPLMVALLFGSFLAVREERWLLAALLASRATIVRPLGIFALLGIGIALLMRRSWRILREHSDRSPRRRTLCHPANSPFRRPARQCEQLPQQGVGRRMAVRSPLLRNCQGNTHRIRASNQFLWFLIWTLYTYNYPHWARGNFDRFAIPILPFAQLALYRWIPKDRRVLWGIAGVTSILAAASAIGISHVAAMIHHFL